MAKIVCEDCGEVIDDGLSSEDAQERVDEQSSHQHADDQRERDDRSDPEELEDELQDEYEDKIDEIDDDERDEQTGEEVSQYEGGAVDSVTVESTIGEEFRERPAIWEEVTQNATGISRVFQDKLRQKRQDDVRREQTGGRFDSSRMVQAERGSPRVFKNREEGDKANYETYILYDRSGSMNGRRIEETTRAVAILSQALQEAGVPSEIASFEGSDMIIEKTKSQRTDEVSDAVLRRSTGGGTPLKKSFKTMRNRVQGTDGQPFMIVATDGQPSDSEEFEDEVNRTSMPVLGVIIGSDPTLDPGQRDRMFDSHIHYEPGDGSLTDGLFDLASQVMF